MISANSKYDVIIIGAGPAGCTCALALKKSGLKILLLDKCAFPRDKICGDAIPGNALKTLQSVSRYHYQKFLDFAEKSFISKSYLYLNNKPKVVLNWQNESYTCQRIHFDNFLLNAVKHDAVVDVIEDFKIDYIENNQKSVFAGNKAKSIIYEASMIVACDGGNSFVSRTLSADASSIKNGLFAVRSLYSNVENLDIDASEIYTLKKYMPGYFWVFPLPNNTANIGFGMQLNALHKRKININEAFYDFIEQSDILKQKLKNSYQLTKLKGGYLPLHFKNKKLCGNRFILCGDAAALINPTSGDGIGNAMTSGKIAAEHIINAFKNKIFSPYTLCNYESAIYKKLGKNLINNLKLLRFCTKFPFIITIISALLRHKITSSFIKRAF